VTQHELIMLDEAAIKRLVKAVGSNLEQILWLADWLLHLNVFSDAQVYDTLNYLKSGIEAFAASVQAGQPQVTTVCVCDSRWVSISGAASFLDTKTSEVVEELPQAAVTHIFCDLAALQLRMEHRKRKFNGNARNQQPAAANPAQAGGNQPAEQAGGTQDVSAHTADV
jgi:hypothetical protein